VHIIKQINNLAVKAEHTEAGELIIHAVATEVPRIERVALEAALNAAVGALHDELAARGVL